MNRMSAVAVLAALLTAGSVRPAAAQLDKLKLSDAIQSLTYSGDMRLRNDVRARRGAGQYNYSQQRFRLRFGLDAAFKDDFNAVFRLASGTGEQVSTNQTAGKLGSQKGIYIDLAYMKWKPKVSDDATFLFAGGRMVNPMWRPYSADVVWDDDYNPEGMGESFEWLFADAGVSVFANGLQMIADQDSNSGKNQWEFSQQVGFETRLPLESRLRLAAAYHKWSDENRSTLSQVAVQDGNRRAANGVLLNRFGVGELSGQISGWAGSLPLSL